MCVAYPTATATWLVSPGNKPSCPFANPQPSLQWGHLVSPTWVNGFHTLGLVQEIHLERIFPSHLVPTQVSDDLFKPPARVGNSV